MPREKFRRARVILGVVPPALLGLLTACPGLMVAVIIVYCVLNR